MYAPHGGAQKKGHDTLRIVALFGSIFANAYIAAFRF